MIVETYSCEEIPWLATGYEWTDPKTLVFDTRDGVKWNDGKPFTAEDVAFTFNMLKKYPALDLEGVWAVPRLGRGRPATTRSRSRSTSPARPRSTMINDVVIVPEHIWSKVDGPDEFTNSEDPVGTGPMKVKAFNPRSSSSSGTRTTGRPTRSRSRSSGSTRPTPVARSSS